MPPVLDGPRVNGAIRVPKVRCIDPEGNQLGVLDTREALTKAEDFGLDLVEVQPNADPPVCKILDYGKFKYEAQKRANEARKKQKTIDVKEIKFRPNIDEHDYQVKMRNVSKFLAAGDPCTSPPARSRIWAPPACHSRRARSGRVARARLHAHAF